MSTNSRGNAQPGVTAPQTPDSDTLVFKEPVEIYFDGSQSNGKTASAIGYVLKDATGRELTRQHFEIDFTTSVQTEFKALIHALETAYEFGINKLEVYGDCSSVIDLTTGDATTNKPPLQRITNRAQALLNDFSESTIKHITRSDNHPADSLAHTALDNATLAD